MIASVPAAAVLASILQVSPGSTSNGQAQNPSLPELSAFGVNLSELAVPVLAFLTFWLLLKAFGAPIRKFATEILFQNWQLGLLGATGLVLSLASGWTTWDGMRNFTQEPILSLMITFGIQGVMLIVAWLIGESFATGMSQRQPARAGAGDHVGGASRPPRFMSLSPGVTGNVFGTAVGIAVFSILAILVLQTFGADETGLITSSTLTGLSNSLLFVTALLILFAAITFGAGRSIWSDYWQAARIMIRSVVLWVMFLACMATSVFFSFDSLFSTIFPAGERQRAAELRAQNQVAGVVNDIGNLATTQRIREAEGLFETEGWRQYEQQLDEVTQVANRSPEAIREQIAAELEEQRRRVAELVEKEASAKSGQAGLVARKTRLGEELSRAQAERPGVAAKVDEHKAIVGEVERRLDEQRAVVLAEERGVEGSGKAGRGPLWRAARAESAKIQAELEVANTRLKGHQDRLIDIDQQIAEIKSELAQIDGDLARFRGEAETAEQLISVAKSNDAAAGVAQVDPAAAVAALEKARQSFRQAPAQELLLTIQDRCLSIQNAALKVRSLRDDAAGIDCDPGTASEAAAPLFALNTGIEALQANCIGGDKLPQTGGADALFAFARGCVQDAGLPSAATDQLRSQINLIELNRDDKAHRFVVTVNAFGDGNRLAYLALAIAIAIDALVFMSGLFGANAVRSPLSDVPSHKSRSAQQLEAVVSNSLMPHTFENATLALEQISPVGRDPGDGWTHEVHLPSRETAERTRLIRVLNAGATIGAVQRDLARPDHFLVRGEFVEFLSIVAKKAFESDQDKVRLAELKKILIVALQPYVGDHAEIVLGYLRPISGRDGFSSEVCVQRDIQDASDRFIVQKAVNAGTTLDFVQKDDRKDEDDRFYLHRDYYRTLATIAAEFRPVGMRALHPQLARAEHGGSVAGGQLRESVGQVATHVGHERQIEDQTGRPKHGGTDLPRYFRGEFLRALPGADESHYEWALANPGLATSAEGALDQIVQADPRLRPFVEDATRGSEEAMRRVYNALDQLYGYDHDSAAQLRDARAEIDRLLPLMMLAPDGQYRAIIQTAISELERAAGRDDGLRSNEELALNRLREHMKDIRQPASPEAAIGAVQAFIASSPSSDSDDDNKIARLPTRNVSGNS